MRRLLFLIAAGAAACAAEAPVEAPPAKAARPPLEIGGARPARVVLPADYTPRKRYPLVVMLHGYGANGTVQDAVFGLKPRVDARQFVLVVPEGKRDADGKQFWNATPECCNFDTPKVDDVAYLRSLVDEALATYAIDPARVAFVGHSNGGYMSYRMACEAPDVVRRIAVLAGSVFLDEADCKGASPVSVLHMHGTEDEVIYYPPATDPVETVGAEAAVSRWRAKAGCEAGFTGPAKADLLDGVAGAETEVFAFRGCAETIDVVFWRMNGGDHLLLDVNDRFRDGVADFLLSPP